MIKNIYTPDFNWQIMVESANAEYKFQPQLTSKLDTHIGEFSELTVLEIVLWKVNRYPELNPDILKEINSLRLLYDEEQARIVLKELLVLRGFDLAMASTVLRFACPHQCQIIDQRVLRFIRQDVGRIKIPFNKDKKVVFYFEYLKELTEICTQFSIPFIMADRIFYQIDKHANKNIPIKY